MTLKILSALLLLFLAACAQIPAKTAGKADRSETGQSKLPNQNLTAPMLFDFLLGETALQRGDQEIATSTYLKLAKTTRDPRVAQRATEIALHARQAGPALEASKIWVELDPNSVTARQTIAALLVNADRLDEARPHLEKLLASEGGSIDEAFMQLNSLLVRGSNKNAAFELVQQLAKPYPQLPEAHFAVSPNAQGGRVIASQFKLNNKRKYANNPFAELSKCLQGYMDSLHVIYRRSTRHQGILHTCRLQNVASYQP